MEMEEILYNDKIKKRLFQAKVQLVTVGVTVVGLSNDGIICIKADEERYIAYFAYFVKKSFH